MGRVRVANDGVNATLGGTRLVVRFAFIRSPCALSSAFLVRIIVEPHRFC